MWLWVYVKDDRNGELDQRSTTTDVRKSGNGCRHSQMIACASRRHTSTQHVPIHAKSAVAMSSSAYRRLRHRNSQMKKMYASLDPDTLKSAIRHSTCSTTTPDRAFELCNIEHEIMPETTGRHTVDEETASAPSLIQQSAPQNLDLPHYGTCLLWYW